MGEKTTGTAADAATLADLDTEAAAELEPFRDRMTSVAWERARDRARRRLLRERLGLPSVAFE